MLISAPGTCVSLIVWGSLFGLILNLIDGQNMKDISSIDCSTDWNITMKVANKSIVRSIFFNFDVVNEKDCPFKEYEVKLLKVLNPNDLNCRCQSVYRTIRVFNKSAVFTNLDVAEYKIVVEPISIDVNGQPLCNNLHKECLIQYSYPITVDPVWESNINVTQSAQSLQVSFKMAPHLGFFRYNISLSPMSDEGNSLQHLFRNKIVESPINSCTFNDLQPGKYKISIRPYEKNETDDCICGNMGTKGCGLCFEVLQTITVEKGPGSLILITIVVVGVVSVVIIAIAVSVLWYKRGAIYQNLVIIDKSTKCKEAFHMKDLQNQKVLLIHGADFEEHETAIHCLADILKCHCMCNVTVVPSHEAKFQAVQNQFQWILKIMQEVDKVILVLSPDIHQKYIELLIQPPQTDLSGDMVLQILSYLIQQESWKQKIILSRFNYTLCNFTLPFLPNDYCYVLPDSLDDLILAIHNVPVDNLETMKIQICKPNTECLKTVVLIAQNYLEVKELTGLKCNRSDSEGYHSSPDDTCHFDV